MNAPNTALSKFAPAEGGLAVIGNPEAMLDQARKVADCLMRLVEEKQLYLTVGKRKHLYVEAWETLAHFYGITAKVTEVRPVIDEITGAAGFEATADAIHMPTGAVISSARSMCLNNEDNWNERPKYEGKGNDRKQTGTVAVPTFQLASMAQTRAVGQVLRNVLAFVVTLAGYQTTPDEEMTGNEPTSTKTDSGNAQPIGPGKISEPQRKRLFAIAKESSCPTNNLVLLFQRKYGFRQAFDITKDKYDALIEDVRNWQKVPEAQPTPAKEGAA